MFKYLVKGLLAGITVKLLDTIRRQSVYLIKIEVTKLYVHVVQIARLSAIGLMRMGLVIGLIGVGALLFHAGLFILLPWTVETKAALALILGVAYVAVGCVVLRAAMDEKTWMKKSGVTEMLEEASSQSKKD